jgi:lipooligosaccharide transport system permease protein
VSTPAAIRVWGSSFALYKQIWRSNLLGSLLQPLLYLLGMGVGVGSLVDRGAGADDILGGVDYVAFLAPSLLATTAMVVVTQESMWPIRDGFSWGYAFRAMAATTLAPRDIVHGVALWHATRGFLGAAGVALVLAVVPATRSWGLLPAVPFAVLTGMAFAGPITAWAASRIDSEQSFPAIMRFGIVPMFLFAGAFYPIEQLPGWLQPVAQATPLYHGVELCRGAVLHTLGVVDALVHVAVLAGFWLVGLTLSARIFARRLAE